MAKDNLMDTIGFEVLKEDNDPKLVEVIHGLVKTLKPVVQQNGKTSKQNLLQTWITIGSAIIILIAIGSFIFSYGGWRTTVDLTLRNSVEAITMHENILKEEREKVWNRFEENKDDRTEMKINAARIENKVDVLDVRQQTIGDDIKKILEKVE